MSRARAQRAEPTRVAESNPFLSLLQMVQPKIEERLEAYLDQQLERSRGFAPEVFRMVDALSVLCRRGGKRLRPALVVVGSRAVTAEGRLDSALEIGVALELLQAYFLIHDDWMDGDTVRRGGPSVHAALARQLRSQQKGAASAVLAGDYAAALALEVLSQIRVSGETSRRLSAVFAEMQVAAVAGQQIDLLAQTRDIEAAYVLKTASYTVKGPLLLGATLAGASPRALETLEAVSRPLGVGFQLRDDLLSAFGDPRRTGKPFGNDLKAGKRTLLVAEALRRTRGPRRQTILKVLGNARARETDLRRALETMEGCGARAAIEARLQELTLQANRALGQGLTRRGRDLLAGAVLALTERGA